MKQLVCAGEAFEDLIFVGLERLPELGEEIKTDRFMATIGGGAVITSVRAARLGMRTQLISALSDAAVTRLKKERVRQPTSAETRTARDHRRSFDRRRSGIRHVQRCELEARASTRQIFCESISPKLERLRRAKADPCSPLFLPA